MNSKIRNTLDDRNADRAARRIQERLNLSLFDIISLSAAMAVLAAIPSVSVLLVTARSACFGFQHGVFAAVGIVVGDLLFVLLAIFGLSMLVETMGSMFFLIRYAGAVYLVSLGVILLRSETASLHLRETNPVASLKSSLLAGLLITLGDQKAFFFYLGFLPAFVDLTVISATDIVTIIAVTILTVGGIKLVYAFVAHRAGKRFGSKTGRQFSILVSGIMIGTGVFILVK
jgi:threonine/homoserine/homoserine lactone efflux protein